MNYFDLPKIDLHCHLDGSIRPQTIIELAQQQNIPLPADNVEDIKPHLIAPETCPNLDEYLKCFALPVAVMQNAESIERIAFELYEDAARENVKYMEVRFGPLLHMQQGLTLDQIIGSVVKGIRRAEQQYDIHGNCILSILRTMPKDQINDVIDAGAKYLNNGVVAFDLAASELPGFCHEFIPYAQYALEKGYKVTIHAGEQGVGQNVYDAIDLLGAERIGHGIHITGHAGAYQLVKDKQTALETCPSSNVQTKAVNRLEQHPFKDFYLDNLPVTINTDNRTVSNTTMTEEVEKVMEQFQLSREDYFNIYQVSVEGSFASEEVKQHLLKFAQ
ncbi:adenosine deaminase [Sansalvadorimonas sp. 2012CJ34-2]|uniref:Adenosine deaminase n=1 Tax=Parendozoicomonas callyspongiae TaxID=2942213 RepID=A0ABT0PFV7_9GAMM|nr:adenosine deaminase [Sansalvadorimonas sp. 2012CJ34-2]MCL6269413.1 adenosine deaminase [Sansalvadorimonas sp. 2012CJ34-2]